MTHGGKWRVWAFPVLASLLLHLPLALPVLRLRPEKTTAEHNLTLVLRAAPAAPESQAAQTAPADAKNTAQRAETRKIPARAKTTKTPEITEKRAAPTAGAAVENNAAASGGEAAKPEGAPDASSAGRETSRAHERPRLPIDAGKLPITKKVDPDYPAFSRKHNEQGLVKITVTIKNNAVTEAEVSESSGYKRLDNSALRAARQWRFDQREQITAVIAFIFKLRD